MPAHTASYGAYGHINMCRRSRYGHYRARRRFLDAIGGVNIGTARSAIRLALAR